LRALFMQPSTRRSPFTRMRSFWNFFSHSWRHLGTRHDVRCGPSACPGSTGLVTARVSNLCQRGLLAAEIGASTISFPMAFGIQRRLTVKQWRMRWIVALCHAALPFQVRLFRSLFYGAENAFDNFILEIALLLDIEMIHIRIMR
jgi:hypothetical protein